MFKSGRIDVCEEISRVLALLDHEATEAQRIAEECGAAHEKLEGHLASINGLRPEMWSRADRKAELARALGYLEAAEDEIDKVQPMVHALGKKGGIFGAKGGLMSRSPGSVSTAPRGDFLYWLKSGFAFSLPFVGFAVIALLAVLFF